MTVKEYILQKFQQFGISVSDADICDMVIAACVGVEDEIDQYCINKVNVAIAKFIPSLLLRATSIGESGFSMSWNTQGIKDYYSYLCKTYGLRDELNDSKPKIRFL